MTDFGKIEGYGKFVRIDPYRKDLHYPKVMEELGKFNQRILEVGCGDGELARLLAERGATVVGYDIAAEKIAEAQKMEQEQPLGIRYVHADAATFRDADPFDAATSVMVLPYPDGEVLPEIFRSTRQSLKKNGKFISVVFNPEFRAFGRRIGSRLFEKLDDDQVQVNFLHPQTGELQFTSVLHQHSSEFYEASALAGGMRGTIWRELYATREAVEALGEEFWRECHAEQPYALLVTK